MYIHSCLSQRIFFVLKLRDQRNILLDLFSLFFPFLNIVLTLFGLNPFHDIKIIFNNLAKFPFSETLIQGFFFGRRVANPEIGWFGALQTDLLKSTDQRIVLFFYLIVSDMIKSCPFCPFIQKQIMLWRTSIDCAFHRFHFGFMNFPAPLQIIVETQFTVCWNGSKHCVLERLLFILWYNNLVYECYYNQDVQIHLFFI